MTDVTVRIHGAALLANPTQSDQPGASRALAFKDLITL